MTITYKERQTTCTVCKGSGQVQVQSLIRPLIMCTNCNGTGIVTIMVEVV